MKTCTCDLCKKEIPKNKEISFSIDGSGKFDFCERCSNVVRRVVCRRCKGTGKFLEVDRDATNRQATCGESRTEYRSVNCYECK